MFNILSDGLVLHLTILFMFDEVWIKNWMDDAENMNPDR
jgi:hypothetical protein